MTGDELKRWRKSVKWPTHAAKGMSRRQLALLLGMTMKSIERWETGAHPLQGAPLNLVLVMRRFTTVREFMRAQVEHVW